MTADTIGGVWTYALELSRALGHACTERSGRVEVVLATMGCPLSPAQRREAGRIPGLHLEESAYKLEWMADPWDDVDMAGDWLQGLEQRWQPDLVHLNSYSFGALPWRVPALVVGHSCVLSWWQAVKGVLAPQEWTRYHDEVRRGLRMASQVVAPSRSMLAALHQHYGAVGTGGRGRVVLNGRDPARFIPQEKRDFVLAAGRVWDEAKNLAALESVAPSLSWPVFIAGDSRRPDGTGHAGPVGRIRAGPERDRKVTDNVRFLGPLATEELALWYGRASIYALPARYEPFGLTALEAALSGCALVLGDIPSLRETWNGAALFVPPEDTEALKWALQVLMSDRQHCAALAARARCRALQYAPERMAEGYLQVYAEMLNAD